MRARPSQHIPVVMTRDEVRRVVLGQMSGDTRLMASLLYGSGLRLNEWLTLRVPDTDFRRGEITVFNGKGTKDRVTMLPQGIQSTLRAHLETVRAVHEQDLRGGRGSVTIPDSLSREFPNAVRDWCWQ